MKSKLFTIFLTALFLTTVASAAVFEVTNEVIPTEVVDNAGSFDITFDVTYTGALSDVDVTFDTSALTTGTGSIDLAPINVAQGDTESVTATVNFDSGQTGNIEGTIEATPSSGTPVNFTFSVLLTESPELELCEVGVPEGSLGVDIKDITVKEGFGDDDDYWYLFDEIEVEVEIENTNDDEKIKNIEIEWGLYSEDLGEWVIDLDEEDEIDIKKDDEKTIIFTFELDDDMDVDIDDLESGDLTLYVVANGEEQEDPEFDVCASDSKSVELRADEDFVIVTNIDMPETISCGDSVTVTAEVWNIGDADQDDVTVRAYNADLQIDETFDVGDIDGFEDERISFTFEVPSDALSTVYPISFTVYDEDNDPFENDEDDEAVTKEELLISGSCVVTPSVSIAAVLDSDAKVGTELVVKATLTNTGSGAANYQVLVTEAGWSDSQNIEPATATVEAGQSQEVTITLMPNEAGDQEFTLQVLSGDEVTEKTISLTIADKGGFGITGGAIGSSSTVVWALVIAIVILVLLIIIVAVNLRGSAAE